MKIALVGVGLIGGSFALGIKRRRLDVEVIGVDKNEQNLIRAKELNIIDRSLKLAEAVEVADVVLLAVPVNVVEVVLKEVLDQSIDGQLIVDFGSTKESICNAVVDHPKRGNYVSAHPMAGTEYSGPDAAFATLFEDKIMILCQQEMSGDEQLQLFHELCKNLAMNVVEMSPKDHDLHIAYVSHLSHVSSFALSTTVLKKEEDEARIFAMAGSGFASTVRLAKSSPAMWGPIFNQNKKNVLQALGAYIDELNAFKNALEESDDEAVDDFMANANRIRPIIDGIN